MKTISRLRYFLYLSILIVGCTTGKNALQKGNYDQSVFKSVDRLKSSPKNAEAMYVLPIAYDLALKEHLRKIDEAKVSSDVLRWETILAHYQKINQLSDEVNGSPVALGLIPNPQKYINEVEDSKYKAAEVRYTLGVNQMNENNRVSAKNAYFNFEKAQYFYPSYRDVKNKMDDAYWAAVVKVVVQPVKVNSGYYQLSNQYFQQQVSDFISSYQQNRFVIFYSEQQANSQKITPDQVLRLSFDDFIVGQTYVKERVEKLKKDSVLISDSRANGKVYGTVKATLSIFNKQVSSSGLLAMTIIDYPSNKIIRQQRLPGTYVWQDNWATYKGDERALTSQQLQMTKRRELLPPAPASLFVEFTKPIYAQLVDEISYFYNKY
ncbi:hypothetical protein EZ428_02120 [Pedobacter frigiditerrae]|uniref:Lipoprotein n=1 Tax=Pedobacter frigiditerrae TaxID=2530452 RepID=A0A4R0N1C2_9SPHI|nr:hypothetical protein [Pedobacter frigiditerrae]TCC93588.1 hypothetical protein EZ428_02120 [Pedobacter frigiditerrae]